MFMVQYERGGFAGAIILYEAALGVGISVGDDSVVEAGLYVTAGTKVTLVPGGEVVKEMVGARPRQALEQELAEYL